MQVAAVRAATENTASIENKTVSLRPVHITTPVPKCEIKPVIVAHDHAVGAVKSVGGFFRWPAQSAEDVATLIGHTVAVRVSQNCQQRRVHDKHPTVMRRQPLNGIEVRGPDRGLVRVTIAV